jgi:phage baseplate assembly protein V
MTPLLNRMITPLRRAIGNMAMRATVTLVNSANKMQSLQVKLRGDEAKENIEHFEPYGFTSKPHAGSEAITLFFNGDRSHGVAIVVADRRYRLNVLADGEVALHDDLAQKVHLKRDRILIETPFTFEVRADKIDLHAASEFKFDVNGQGEKWDGSGVETWRDDDTVKPHHNHAPPEIP